MTQSGLGSAEWMCRLGDLHVPENRRAELENIPDVFPDGGRLEPFSPRHVGHFAESDPLDLVGEVLLFWLVGCARPVGYERLELGDVRPTEPGTRLGARQSKVNRGIDDVSGLKIRMEQVPPALVGRLLERAYEEARRPIHRPEDYLEADRFQPLPRDDRGGVEVRPVGDLEHDDRVAFVTRLSDELPSLCEVMLHHRPGVNRRCVGAAASEYRIAGTVVLRLSDHPGE